MSDLPEPLTPLECDCRGLPFMPLDVTRLRESDLAALATGDEFKAAVLLWCASWNQLPAASLPDDDRVLARLSGYSLAEWRGLREMALKNWALCSDGRLYHPVVAEKATEAWRHRLAQRDRAVKRWATRPPDKPPGEPRESHGMASGMPRHALADAPAMQGTGTGTGTDKAPDGALSGKPDLPMVSRADVDAIWSITPRKSRERSSRGELERALKAAGNRGHHPAEIARALQRYFAGPDATKDGGERVKGVHRMVEVDRWQSWVEANELADVSAWGDAQWAQALRLFREEGLWSVELGPKPGEPGCIAPRCMLVEAVA